MPVTPVPPPASADGALFGAPLARPRRVPDKLSDDHSADMRQQMHGELLDRYGSLDGVDTRPSVRPYAPFGAAPTRQARRVYVAKFNPAESDPGTGRFSASDPFGEPALWDISGSPSSWLGDWGIRTTAEHSTITGGDLVFVQRSIPRTDYVPVDSDDPLGGRRVLLGVWWVTHVHRRWLARHPHRPVTTVWHAPLVRFDEVVDVATIRRHSDLADLAPFTDQRQAGLVAADPVEAAALAAACSLPSWILTDPDPVDITRRLTAVRTGMRDEDLRYARDTRARYEYIHAIETAATNRVRDQLAAAGWSVMSREKRPRWGADLAAVRRRGSGAEERRAVEVKGTGSARWADVELQQSQWERACASAAAQDDQWWLAVCARALAAAPPPMRQLPASWVSKNWRADRIRAAGGWAGPQSDDFTNRSA